MKKRIITAFVLGLTFASMTACTRSQVGTSVGAAGGAGLGYAVSGGSGWGAAAGAAGGALIGHHIANN